MSPLLHVFGWGCLPSSDFFLNIFFFFSSFIYLFLDFCSLALQCQTQSTCVFLASLCAVGPHIRPGKEGP